ncbi:MAG TPA: hypothetical protein PK548_04735 [Bacteroidales bacterium]|nr:hypothetical protein [Bacteroidales bacterium]
MPPRYARGRRPVPSPRAQAVGTQGGKKSLQARFFAAASPSASALAGFPPKRLTRNFRLRCHKDKTCLSLRKYFFLIILSLYIKKFYTFVSLYSNFFEKIIFQ